jgi:hypothetical protein
VWRNGRFTTVTSRKLLSPSLNQGEQAVLYCFIFFLFLAADGAGA